MRENPRFREAAKSIAEHLASGHYDQLVKSGMLAATDVAGVREEIEHYGRTLSGLPAEALEAAHEYDLGDGSYRVEVQLWTAEEGESDLTLTLNARQSSSGAPIVRLQKVHVM